MLVMKKGNLITVVIVVLIVAFAIYVRTRDVPNASEEIARCIGENAVLYVQLGCHACETQEGLFGDSYELLSVVDCFYERDKCVGISRTPTWVIGGEKIVGVKSVAELRELTGC